MADRQRAGNVEIIARTVVDHLRVGIARNFRTERDRNAVATRETGGRPMTAEMNSAAETTAARSTPVAMPSPSSM